MELEDKQKISFFEYFTNYVNPKPSKYQIEQAKLFQEKFDEGLRPKIIRKRGGGSEWIWVKKE